MEFTKEQLEIINSNESKIVVTANAGSGKTTVLVERVRRLLSSGADPKKIVVITFTNSAADELKKRIENSENLFIGTIHSYCYNLLVEGGYGSVVMGLAQEERFDKFFEVIEQYPHCIKKVDHLLLDEAQDSDSLQFSFIFNLVKPKNFMLVGDWRQSIYRWKGSEPNLLINMVSEPDVKTYPLSKNYRCGSEILNFARNIIKKNGIFYIDNSVADRIGGEVIFKELTYDQVLSGIGVVGEPKDWFLLARTNEDVEILKSKLEKKGLPFVVVRKKDYNNEQLNLILKENKIKLMTIHQSKGLESKNVAVVGVRWHSVEEVCINYVAATRAKDLLVWAKPVSKKKKRMAF